MTNVAQTIWQPGGSGEGEYAQSTAVALVDPSGVAIIDPVSVAIFDTGVTYTEVPVTTWAASDGS